MIDKGDLVRHPVRPSWGIGRVVKTLSGGNLLVRFAEVGNKLLNPGFAGLVKIQDNELLFLVIRGVHVKKGRPIRTVRVIPVVKEAGFKVCGREETHCERL